MRMPLIGNISMVGTDIFMVLNRKVELLATVFFFRPEKSIIIAQKSM
jgi:hypothetical protein